MLPTITDYKQKITLIQDSGLQFLDFALKAAIDAQGPGKFVPKTANGPLLRLILNEENGKYLLPAPLESAPEVVRPESSFSLGQSLLPPSVNNVLKPTSALHCVALSIRRTT